MTAWLMDQLARVRGPLGRQVAFFVLGAVALPLAWFVDALVAFVRQERQRAVLSDSEVLCPRGHVVELVGGWQCGACGAVFEGHGFAPCPFDGTVAGYVSCPCGASVRNPLFTGRAR